MKITLRHSVLTICLICLLSIVVLVPAVTCYHCSGSGILVHSFNGSVDMRDCPTCGAKGKITWLQRGMRALWWEWKGD